MDNYARGRTKHIWFSISTDLIVDARRDLSDIGCYIRVIEGAQQLDKETRYDVEKMNCSAVNDSDV